MNLTQSNVQDNRASVWITQAMEVLWLAIVVAIPLILNPWGSSAFELPKSILLKALVLLWGFLALVRGLDSWGNPAPLRKNHLPVLIWPVLAFGSSVLLATIFSVEPRASLWGTLDRQQGMLTTGAYLALCLLAATHLQTRDQIDRLFKAIAWGSVPVVLYGLVQAAGFDPLDWQTDAASPVLSTIGRANFVGSYLVLVLPITLRQCVHGPSRWPYGAIAAGQALCLLLTQARGAWFGAAAVLFTWVLLWAITRGKRRLTWLTLSIAALVLLFILLLNWPHGPLALLTRLPGLDRMAVLFRTDAGSTAARLTIWRATLPLIAGRPLLGYGPETMRQVFMGVFPPQLVYYQGRHVTVDRAHNLWLDAGMSAGWAGILTLGAVLACVGWQVWSGLRRARDPWMRVTWIALAAALVGHIVDMEFSFDLTASATIFWLLIGVAAAGERIVEVPPPVPVPFPRLKVLLPYLPILLVLLVLLGMLCVRPLLADLACWQAQQERQPIPTRLQAAKRAVRLWPVEPHYHVVLAWQYLEWGDPTRAEAQLNAATALSPTDARLWATCGGLYARWAEIDPLQFATAEAAYRQAIDLAPNVAAYHTSLGVVLARQGRWQESTTVLERAVDLDVTDGMAYLHLANVYHITGRYSAAYEAWTQALRWGIKNTLYH